MPQVREDAVREFAGYQGVVEAGDCAGVRMAARPDQPAYPFFALYLADNVLLSFDVDEPQVATAYLQRVADQALALLSEISTAAAARAAKEATADG